jgi:transposase-like protein
MSGRQAKETLLALALVARGHTVSEAARRHGLSVSTVRRALRRAGEAPKAPGRPAQG